MSDYDTIDKSSSLDALFGNAASAETKSKSSLDSLFGNNPPSSGMQISNKSNSLDALFGKSDTSSSSGSPHNPLLEAKESSSSPLDTLFSKSANDVHFCRDCRYFIPHPYHCRCALTENVVSPTDDCPNYAKPLAPAK